MRTTRGTSLVELLVVLALLSMMILAAAQLVIHSIQLLGATGRSVRNPILVHVTNRLRNDVQEAAGVAAVEDIWTEDPLQLTTRKLCDRPNNRTSAILMSLAPLTHVG